MLKGDFILGSWFHKSAYVGDNDDPGSDPPRPQEESPSAPDDVHKKIYVEATPTIQALMKNPRNGEIKSEIEKYNERIVEHNKERKKPQDEWNNNIINLGTLLPHYDIIADLFKKTDTQGNRAALLKVNQTLSQINTRFGYPSTWIAEAPPEWPQDTENSCQPQKDKSATDQARGQGAAAESYDPDPSFKGIRTRDNEPILGWRKVGRDGRQYLVQTGSPEHQAFELRSQAGDDGVGRRVGRAYEASINAVQLGKIDERFTKDDADRYVGITGVAYKPLQAVSDNYRDRYPVTLARAKFKNPSEEHWVYRTTVRRVAGKRDADLDIHDWSKSRGFVPSDEAPPRKILMENKAYVSVFPGRARARIRADDEDRALPEKETKTLTDGQEELRTRLDKLEKETKEKQQILSDQLASLTADMNGKFDSIMDILKRMAPGSS